jgi:four helix bundle protein
MAGSYKDLIAWQKGMLLALDVYRASRAFPRDELYGLTSQLRRAAVAVPSKIAEGQARYSRQEFCHFLNNARGSLAELETQITLARELECLERKRSRRPPRPGRRTRTHSEWTDCIDQSSPVKNPVFLSTEYRVLSTDLLLFHSKLPKQKRIHVGKFFDLLCHGLARTMSGFTLDAQ